MGGLFRIADFRRLWVAGSVASAVRWLDALSFSVVAYQQSGSAFIVAMLMMLRLLPMGLFGTVMGALAERVQRRTVLATMNLAMLITALGLMALAASGRLAIWHLAVASFLNGISWLSDSTVRRMMLGEVVGGERVSAAVSFDSASANLCRMLGPTAGGFLLAGIGITGAFGLGAALYAVSLVSVWGLKFRNPILAAGGPSILSRIVGGLSFARRDPRLVGVLVITVIFNLWGWPTTSMIPVLAQGRMLLGPEATGVLVSMDGFGALVASLIIGAKAPPGLHGRLYVAGTAFYAAMQLFLAAAADPWLAGFAVFMTGIASASFGIMQTTLIYLATPADMRSRVFGVLTACIGLGPLGFLHLGILADVVGAPWATAISAIEGMVAMALTWKLWRGLLTRV